MIKFLVSKIPTDQYGVVALEQVFYRIRHPDPGSPFAQMRGDIRTQDDETALKTLLGLKYEGIVFVADRVKQVVGEIYFQAHGNELHMFACEVPLEFRFQKIATQLVTDYLEHAWREGFRLVRVSMGNDTYGVIRRIFEKALRGEIAFSGFRLERGGGEGYGWARLVPIIGEAVSDAALTATD